MWRQLKYASGRPQRNVGRTIDQNVGAISTGCCKADRRILGPCRFLLELGHSVEPAEPRDAIEHPGQFGMFGDPALVEDDAFGSMPQARRLLSLRGCGRLLGWGIVIACRSTTQ